MVNPSSPDSSPERSPSISHVIALLALAGLLLLLDLGGLGLTDRDEGSNAEAAREMLETGNWVSPTLNYEPRFAKPAFVYWIISGSYLLFGVNEFAARLPSALFGIGLILLQYRFLTRVVGSTIALLGSLILLLNMEVIAINRMVLTDPALVFFTTLSGYCFWLGISQEGKNRLYFFGFYMAMAMAMLAKGPVGILIPLLGVFTYLTFARQWRRFGKVGFPVLGFLLVFAISAPWYLAMFAMHGDAYLAAAQANTTGRLANPMEGHGGTLIFYIPILFLGFFPWSGFLPASLHQTLKDWKQYRNGEHVPTQEEGLALFAAFWVISLFLFFTLSATRLPHYIFPLFPPAAILVVLYWSRCLNESSPPGLRVSIRILVLIGYLLGLALAAAPAVFEELLEKITSEFPAASQLNLGFIPVVMGGVVIVGTMMVRHLTSSEQHRDQAFWAAGAMIGGLALLVILFGLPQFSRYFIAPPQELARIAGYNLGPEDRLIQFGRKRPSLAFYAKRKVFQVNPGEDTKLEAATAGPGRKMIVLQTHLRSRLPPSVREYPVVLERHGFSLLSSESLLK
ncbi:MAG: glycosyltransferase family 39 protein [Nitrospirota bacterium]|nr:MAG: glycosyltransferase family 39 protein [Nitrospirota bacterium]